VFFKRLSDYTLIEIDRRGVLSAPSEAGFQAVGYSCRDRRLGVRCPHDHDRDFMLDIVMLGK